MAKATAHFEIKNWDEKPYDGSEDVPQLVQADVTTAYSGEIEGEGKARYLMTYRPDGVATYVVLERFSGKIGDREGSVVLWGSGDFENGVAKTAWTIVPKSGTGDLSGISGTGGYGAVHGEEQVPIELEYSFDEE